MTKEQLNKGVANLFKLAGDAKKVEPIIKEKTLSGSYSERDKGLESFLSKNKMWKNAGVLEDLEENFKQNPQTYAYAGLGALGGGALGAASNKDHRVRNGLIGALTGGTAGGLAGQRMDKDYSTIIGQGADLTHQKNMTREYDNLYHNEHDVRPGSAWNDDWSSAINNDKMNYKGNLKQLGANLTPNIYMSHADERAAHN